MRMTYSKQMEPKIYIHEEKMLSIYVQQIKKYDIAFRRKGYELKCGLMWKDNSSKLATMQRVNFQNGYECYVYCVVQENGEEVHIDSTDGEADYYSLSTAWMISSIRRKWGRLQVNLFSEMDEVDTEIENFLIQCDSKTESSI